MAAPLYNYLSSLQKKRDNPSLATPNTAISNVAATPTVPTTISAPQKTLSKSPAAQQYTQSLVGNTTANNYNPSPIQTPPAYTQPGYQSPGQIADTATLNKQNGVNSAGSSNPQSAYLKYLTGMFDENTVGNARQDLESSQKKLADIQTKQEQETLRSRREYQDILDRSGGSKAGAQEAATLNNRRNDQQLADIALQEGAAARSAQVASNAYNMYINAGKSVYEAEQAAEKAKKEDERYNSETAYKQEQDKISNDLSLKKFEEDRRQFGMEYALKARELSQSGSGSSGGTPEQVAQKQQQSTQTFDLVNNLLNGDAFKGITGIGQNPLNAVGLANGKAINEYNQLQGLLKLGVRSLIKGQGAVSDYEGKILGQAASALGRNLSNEDFAKQLKKIRGVVQTNNGGETSVIVKNKDGKIIGQGSLNGQDIYEATNDGNTVEYQ